MDRDEISYPSLQLPQVCSIHFVACVMVLITIHLVVLVVGWFFEAVTFLVSK